MTGQSAIRPIAADDNRSVFNCGRESLNLWLLRHAWRNQQSGMSRSYVIHDDAQHRIAGYMALSIGRLEREYVTKRDQRNAPDPIPIALLGQLAVDLDYQGNGIAKRLLAHAYKTVVTLAHEVGCFALVTHPLDNNARAFYEHWGFQPLPADPRGSYFVRVRDIEHSGTQ